MKNIIYVDHDYDDHDYDDHDYDDHDYDDHDHDFDDEDDIDDDNGNLLSCVMVKQPPSQPTSPPGKGPTDLCH